MKVVVAVLLTILLILGWLLNAEIATNSQLTSKLGDKTSRENLELQEKCDLQARKIFNDPVNVAESRNKTGGHFQDYQSHYNVKLSKCFVTTRSSTLGNAPDSFVSEGLLDAYERRDYASYIWDSRMATDKLNWKLQPHVCKLIPSSSGERECQSYEEYKAFVATYME